MRSAEAVFEMPRAQAFFGACAPAEARLFKCRVLKRLIFTLRLSGNASFYKCGALKRSFELPCAEAQKQKEALTRDKERIPPEKHP